mmetsp:Transcript_1311/g.1996  ORF Transcript_1311/g.1996 Transcript_1311/m.1996 type:complete len:82 (+) Transcript_1311:85-330(+)
MDEEIAHNTIPLDKVTLYYNELCFVERQAKVNLGIANTFTVRVPKKSSQVVVDTFSASTDDGSNCVVKVSDKKKERLGTDF